MDLRPARPASRDGFEIAIICALPLEADAVEALFDHFWDDDGIPFDKAAVDPNTYSTGTIGRHNVVLACLPGMGKVNAAMVANNCRVSFPNIKLGLVVGIAGVVPFGPDGQEIILGDVIISDAIIQYDFGRQLPERFARKDTLLDSFGRPNTEIRTFLASLKRLRRLKSLGSDIAEHLATLRKESQLAATYPGVEHDKLFEPRYRHLGDKDTCDKAGCNGKLVPRHRLQASPDSSPTPAIHFGLIACGDTVMKSGEDRDVVAVAESVIAFEMEGTGVWDVLPCVVIKGGCDYADNHKNKKWQRYAAATAAACMKAFLKTWVPSVTKQPSTETSCPIAKPRTFFVPFANNEDFVGRDDSIRLLMDLTLAETNTKQRMALFGMGGVGKTQILLKITYLMKDQDPERNIFWLPAHSMVGFEQACAGCVEKLKLARPENDDPKEVLRRYLSSDDAGQWLLILDNADDEDILQGYDDTTGIYAYLPRSLQGQILITTRSRKIAVDFAKKNIIQITEMENNDAKNLMLS
ncbi:hypothetical protein VHEMI02808 [[Torrubiella] hemipterigena]|uniref:Nucleoside phosphorylase domain-containing protein n=1 Tax=[Torrubiella] hemipterigena TaxID=1531966 RepID=A0A0A1T9B4_9HYPO|nr:hypothetical protein VHEMI02808 [[Torrubiella] hemipterigena]